MASTNERGNHEGYEHHGGYYRGGYEHHDDYRHHYDRHYGGYRGWGRKLMNQLVSNSQLLPAAAAVHPAAASTQAAGAIPPTTTTTSVNERGGYGHSHGGYGHSHGGYHGGHYGGYHGGHHHHHGGHGGWGRKLMELVGLSSTTLPTPADLPKPAAILAKPSAADKPVMAKLQGALDTPAAPLGPTGTTQPASSANERGNYNHGSYHGGYGHSHGGYNHGGYHGGYDHGVYHDEHRHGSWGRKLTSDDKPATTATPAQATPDLSYRAASHNGAPHTVSADVTTAPLAVPTNPQASMSTPATPEPTSKVTPQEAAPHSVPAGASAAPLAAPTTQPSAGASSERGNYGGHGGFNHGGHNHGGYNHRGHHDEHRHGGWGRKLLNLVSTPSTPQATGPLAVPITQLAAGASNERGNYGGYGHGHGGYGGHGHGYEHHGGYQHHHWGV